MGKLFFVYLSITLTTIALKMELLDCKPIEIIFKGDECPCAGREYKEGCEHGVLQGYGLPSGRLGTGDCSQTKYKIRQQNAQVKYIFDYNVEVPVESPKTNAPLTDLFARVDKILIDSGSAKVVNTDCRCNNQAPTQAEVVAPCPVHGGSAQTRCSSGGYRVPIQYSRYDSELHGKSRNKRELNLINILKNMNHSRRKKRLVKRDLRTETRLQTDQRRILPEVLQYIPELLSRDFELGQCFTCCPTRQKNRTANANLPLEILCEPTNPKVPNLNNFDESNAYLETRTVQNNQRLQDYEVERKGNPKIFQLNENVGEPHNHYYDPYEDYIRDVISTHPDFIKSSDYGEGHLAPSTAIQEEHARDYIQKLIQDYQSNNEEQLHIHDDAIHDRQHRSSQLEIIPISGTDNIESFVVKLTPSEEHKSTGEINFKNANKNDK